MIEGKLGLVEEQKNDETYTEALLSKIKKTKTEQKKIQIALYARVSTNSQELDNQLLQLRDFAEKQNWEIVKEYKEIVSGANPKRPEFDKMMHDASKRLFDLVLFWDLCRFSRSGTLYTLQKLRQLEGCGCGWHSFQESFISTTGPLKDVVLALFSTMAKLERDKISERTKAGLARAAEQGRFPGRPKKEGKINE